MGGKERGGAGLASDFICIQFYGFQILLPVLQNLPIRPILLFDSCQRFLYNTICDLSIVWEDLKRLLPFSFNRPKNHFMQGLTELYLYLSRSFKSLLLNLYITLLLY